MPFSKYGLIAKKVKRGSRFIVEVRDMRTGRFVKGTNKKWNSSLTLEKSVDASFIKIKSASKQEKQEKVELKKQEPEKVEFNNRARLDLVINIAYEPKARHRQFNHIVSEIDIEIEYELFDEFILTADILENRIKTDKDVQKFSKAIINSFLEVKIPFDVFDINIERHSDFQSHEKGIDILVSTQLRGRNIDRSTDSNNLKNALIDVIETVIM